MESGDLKRRQHRSERFIIRRTHGWAVVMLCLLMSSCIFGDTKPKLLLSEALTMLPKLNTEAQVIAQIRASDGVEYFNPGHFEEDYAPNRHKREEWTDFSVFLPPTLIDRLPVGTKMLVYGFSYRPSLTGGALLVYVDGQGQVLGWSYSKTLKGLEKASVLDEY